MKVNRVIVDETLVDDDQFVRSTYQSNSEQDIPYLAGKFQSLVPHKQKDSRLDFIKRKYFNESFLFNETIDIGYNGLYYLVISVGYKIEKFLFSPNEVKADIFVHKDGRLIYSFYNPTKQNTITVKGKISEDADKIALKIKANLDDIMFRNYFLTLAQEGVGQVGKVPEYYPPIMTVKQTAAYLNVKEKTIRKWTSENKIPFTKIGNNVRCRKSDLDSFLDKNTKKPKSV